MIPTTSPPTTDSSEPPHPKLLLDGAGVGLRVQPVHVIVDGAQLTGGDGGVAAETGFQNGVVDKDILLLQKTASSLRTRRTHKKKSSWRNPPPKKKTARSRQELCRNNDEFCDLTSNFTPQASFYD